MLDCVFILLIFFIATTTFKKQKVEVKITLPESKALGGATSAPEARTTITVTKEQKLFLEAKPVALDKLAIALTSLKEAKPDAKLELEADTDANRGMRVTIWDARREAGYSINDVPARIQRAAAQ